MTTRTSSNSKPEHHDKYCSSCGKGLKAKAIVCIHCGVKVERPAGYKNKIVAALLAFFLGSFGIHKFYLRETLWGVIYLLFSWTVIPTIFSVVEAIMYLAVSDEYFDERYNKPDGSPPDFNWTHLVIFVFFMLVAVLFQIFVFGIMFTGMLAAFLWGTHHMGGYYMGGY